MGALSQDRNLGKGNAEARVLGEFLLIGLSVKSVTAGDAKLLREASQKKLFF